ncbi:MAG: AraC family transcriptional regulator [Fimbriimonadaceae bacterium]|nr:AraC family transcriptional regulator [Fimbriimonadaceae bacterium]
MLNDINAMSLAAGLPVRCVSAGIFTPRDENRYPERTLAAYQLIFVRNGSLHISQGGVQHTVEADQTLLLWPGRRHFGWKVNPMNLVYYWTYFTLSGEAEGADGNLVVPAATRVARPDHLVALFQRLLDDLDVAPGGSLAADATVLSVLCETSLKLPGEAAHEATATLAIRANAIVRTCFHQPITTSAIADKLACCPDYLGRVYRKVYGISLVEAIHRRRIQHARHLLTIGELSLDEVARHCGFTDSGYFRRIFKRHEKMTPVHYLALHVGGAVEPERPARSGR